MKKRDKIKNWFEKNKLISAVLIVAITIALIISAIKLAQYIDFVFGQEVLVSLNASKTDLVLENGQTNQIIFGVKRVTRPFCSTECVAEFQSISENKTLLKQTVRAGPNQEKRIAVNVTASGDTFGQDIYRFSIECKNLNSFLCPTSEIPIYRTKIITVNREQNSSQKQESHQIESKIVQIKTNLLTGSELIANLKQNFLLLNELIDLNGTENQIQNLESIKENLNDSLSEIISNWQLQKNNLVKAQEESLSLKIENFDKDLENLSEQITNNFETYNGLVSTINTTRKLLFNLSQKQLTLQEKEFLENQTNKFNSLVSQFSLTRNLEIKKILVMELNNLDLDQLINAAPTNESVYQSTIPIIGELNQLQKINYTSQNLTFQLEPQKSVCCIRESCQSCCLNCEDKDYPVLMLHGHDFTKDISAEFSLNIFNDLQKKLDQEDFINAGEIALSQDIDRENGLLGIFNVPLTFRGSYYYDLVKSSDGYVPVQTKSENLDTYALRIADVINEVKRETGKDKVIIVTHSMGGLVARRYIQIFGNSSVDKIIMVAAPNNGITSSVARYCSYFGTDKECSDMTQGSDFLNKLNDLPSDSVPTYNIIGSGCDMGGENGDGIVLQKNAFLNKANQNIIINGTCAGIGVLHGDILRFNVHPETYEEIKKILEN